LQRVEVKFVSFFIKARKFREALDVEFEKKNFTTHKLCVPALKKTLSFALSAFIISFKIKKLCVLCVKKNSSFALSAFIISSKNKKTLRPPR